MSTNCQFTVKVKTKIDKYFNKNLVDKIGVESRFINRKPKKITAYIFF